MFGVEKMSAAGVPGQVLDHLFGGGVTVHLTPGGPAHTDPACHLAGPGARPVRVDLRAGCGPDLCPSCPLDLGAALALQLQAGRVLTEAYTAAQATGEAPVVLRRTWQALAHVEAYLPRGDEVLTRAHQHVVALLTARFTTTAATLSTPRPAWLAALAAQDHTARLAVAAAPGPLGLTAARLLRQDAAGYLLTGTDPADLPEALQAGPHPPRLREVLQQAADRLAAVGHALAGDPDVVVQVPLTRFRGDPALLAPGAGLHLTGSPARCTTVVPAPVAHTLHLPVCGTAQPGDADRLGQVHTLILTGLDPADALATARAVSL
jgi:hypothetical protein